MCALIPIVCFGNFFHADKLMGKMKKDFDEEIKEQEKKMKAAMATGETQMI